MNPPDENTTLWAVTGNDLLSGRVAYLGNAGGFVTGLESARLFSKQQSAQACLDLAITFSQDMVDLHLIALTRSDDVVAAKTLREQIRHHGPSQSV